MTLDQVKSKLESHILVSVPDRDMKIEDSQGHVLAEDIISTIDVPGFDRATMDGYAVKAQDTFGANEVQPRVLKLVGRIEPGEESVFTLSRGEASEIATGAALLVGANAVLMVEHSRISGEVVQIFKSVTPGENVMAAGSDIMAGELLLRRDQPITSREVGILAALGKRSVRVHGSPKVAIISTGNELVAPGSTLGKAKIYDINAPALAAAVRDSGGVPIMLGIAQDDENKISELLEEALRVADIVLTSGSTSAGRRDLLPRLISSLKNSQILANGLAVKPGKPALAALVGVKPLFALPGNPTSALMVFHALVKPIIKSLAGMATQSDEHLVEAQVAFKTFSVRGKQELLPVHVVTDEVGGYLAYPALAGSGAITSFAVADGFVKIPADRDILLEGERVQVHLFSPAIEIADLVIIGSHCIGIDVLLKMMSRHQRLVSSKIINVGSLGGLHAVKRGEADLAGIHLLDETSGDYNTPFIKRLKLEEKVVLVRGYAREQGLITAKGNPKRIQNYEDLLRPEVIFINRNAGSGTRIIIDMGLTALAREKAIPFETLTQRIEGYDLEAKSHSAVAAAILHGKVDVGLGIRTVAVQNGLDFISRSRERFDFAIGKSRMHKNSIRLFLETLKSEEFKQTLGKQAPGLCADDETGNQILIS
jgi:putative molybdopterin biosynthesis protein